MEEHYKNKEEKEKDYWERVEKRFKLLKKDFLITYRNSGHPKRLVENKITEIENLLFNGPTTLKNEHHRKHYQEIESPSFRIREIKEGEKPKRDLGDISSPEDFNDGQGHLKIMVEAKWKFCKWLQKGEFSTQDESTPIELNQSFEDYLTKEGLSILPKLKELYKDAKPDKIAYMLFALSDLSLLRISLNDNKTQLYKALKPTFGKIGGRSTLNTNINKLEASSEHEQNQIAMHRKVIKKLLEN